MGRNSVPSSPLPSSGERMSEEDAPPSEAVVEVAPARRGVDDADVDEDECDDVAVPADEDEGDGEDDDVGENIAELHEAPSPVPSVPV